MDFSTRYGLVEKKLQLESIDDDLLHSIWNQLEELFNKIYNLSKTCFNYSESLKTMLEIFWCDFFKQPIYLFNRATHLIEKVQIIRDKYYKLPWYEIYSFLEFTVHLLKIFPDQKTKFIETCNYILARENSAYHFIGDLIVPITSKIEIESIVEGLTEEDEAAKHIEEALIMIANKQYDQLRPCIARALLAVEAMAKKITGDKNSTLASLCQRLKIIPNHHQARKALSNLYNYGSDKEGIRHSLTDESSPVTLAWARFLLVTCSAFINLIKSEKMEVEYI